MRVDGGGGTMAFDNMMNRAVRGTTDWTQTSIVLDVPAEAEGIMFGLILSGSGEAWIDDASLEVVGTDVATTNMVGPTADSSKVAAQRASFAGRPGTPINLKIEP